MAHVTQTTVALCVAASMLLTACGSQRSVADPATGDASDINYVFDDIVRNRELIHEYSAPETIAEAVPVYTQTSSIAEVPISFSDELIFGRVVSAVEGEARAHTGEDEYRVVDFDDPEADEQSLDVTVEVAQRFGPQGAEEASTVTFELGLGGAQYPERFLRGAAALGDVVVFLNHDSSGRGARTHYPALLGAGIGRSDDNGVITFPGLGDDADEFMGQTDTLEELAALAERA